MKYDRAACRSICPTYLIGVLQVNILSAGEKWASLKQMTLMNLSGWALSFFSKWLPQLSMATPTQICLIEGSCALIHIILIRDHLYGTSLLWSLFHKNVIDSAVICFLKHIHYSAGHKVHHYFSLTDYYKIKSTCSIGDFA